MKKILFFTSNDHRSWGGSEELWLACANDALKLGLEVGICVQWDPLPSKLNTLKDFRNFTLFKKQPSSFFVRVYNRFTPRKFRIEPSPYPKALIKWSPDVIILSQGNSADGLDAMQFCMQNKIKYFTICQAVYEGFWPDTEKADKMRNGYNNAIANYFVSNANLNTTILQIGEGVKNAKVVRNPFNVPYYNNIAYPDTSIFKFACVARYEFFAKGQDVLLEVLSQDKWKNRNVITTLFGNGLNEEGLHRLIRYFNLKNVFVGGQVQTSDIWKQNHALVLPSRFEGLPLALVEAMLSGRFGIVSNVSGNKEVFINEQSGFLAEAPQAEYFDIAMEKAWQRKDEWEAIGIKAKQYIKTIVPENPGKELLNMITANI